MIVLADGFLEVTVPVAFIDAPAHEAADPQLVVSARPRVLRGRSEIQAVVRGGRLKLFRGIADLEAARALGLRELNVFVRKFNHGRGC